MGSTHPPTCPSVHTSKYQPIRDPPIHQLTWLSVNQPSLHPPTHPPTYPQSSTYLHLITHAPTHPSIIHPPHIYLLTHLFLPSLIHTVIGGLAVPGTEPRMRERVCRPRKELHPWGQQLLLCQRGSWKEEVRVPEVQPPGSQDSEGSSGRQSGGSTRPRRGGGGGGCRGRALLLPPVSCTNIQL